MGSAASERRHVSKHRLEGSLADTPMSELLATLRRQLFTGTVTVRRGRKGDTLHLSAGVVHRADVQGKQADIEETVKKLGGLRDGMYEVQQRLPDLSGELGSSASLEGEVSDVPLAAIMRHCEENALTCSLIVVGGFDRGEIVYRAGEIADVILNGQRDIDQIVEITSWKECRFRVTAPPLALDVKGWPTVSREPTQPFKIAKGTAETLHALGNAPAAEPRRKAKSRSDVSPKAEPKRSIPLPPALRPSIMRRLVSLVRAGR
jgi:hypothetical protein